MKPGRLKIMTVEPVSPVFSLEEAIALARRAHSGQTDKAGRPYIEHPLRVMHRLHGEYERMAAILHDVLEDTPITESFRPLITPAGLASGIFRFLPSATANADYLNNLGYAQLKQSLTASELASAADALERAHELAPDSARIRNNLALADQKSGRAAQLHTLLDTVADPARRKLLADFAANGNPTGSQP